MALLYTLGLFKDIGNEEEKLYTNMLKLITPEVNLETSFNHSTNESSPFFTIRNAKVLLFSIYD